MPHFFTPEEANKKLPEVRSLVAYIVELKRKIDIEDQGRKRSELMDELGMSASKLEQLGIELKDMNTGLIDFPAMRYNEPVCLCWKLGEKEVLYWHNMVEGFRGRKLLRPEMAQIR
ncbi:MAG: DUF2203 family protein [Nitrososphaerales archaeon]